MGVFVCVFVVMVVGRDHLLRVIYYVEQCYLTHILHKIFIMGDVFILSLSNIIVCLYIVYIYIYIYIYIYMYTLFASFD